MADKPRIEFFHPGEDTSYRVGSRLYHEHDMNDALGARIDWYNKFKDLEKTMEAQHDKKQQGRGIKTMKTMWIVFMWAQVITVVEIYIMKVWLRLF